MHALFRNAVAHTDGFRDVDPLLLKEHPKAARLVDVREPSEFNAELGHIEGAELVPLATVEAAAAAWDRDADLVVICRSGGRSARAAKALVAMGFSRVMNLRGGMLAWNELRFPVSRA
jgi:rhodanese-related sulfurtransferase